MKIPYGMANFGLIRSEGYFYVDKTPFLPQLESSELGYRNIIFLRPRRMGKSALVSMLGYYFYGTWAAAGPTAEERRQTLETILSSGHIFAQLIEPFGQSCLSSSDRFISLLYYTGMLTLSPEPPRGNAHRFEVPNRVIRELGWEQLAALHKEALFREMGGTPVEVISGAPSLS